jgi:hypothetical protein
MDEFPRCGAVISIDATAENVQMLSSPHLTPLTFIHFLSNLLASYFVVKAETAMGSLLRLPRELRDLIWAYCIDYPDMSALLEKNMETARTSFASRFGPDIPIERIEELLPWSTIIQPQPLPMKTPPILLVNQQICSEAVEILRKSIWHLETPIPANFRRDIRDVSITDFIGEETLSSIRVASLRISFQTLKMSNAWYRTINQLIDIWSSKNHLKSLSVLVEPMYFTPGNETDSEKAKRRIRHHSLNNASHFLVHSLSDVLTRNS